MKKPYLTFVFTLLALACLLILIGAGGTRLQGGKLFSGEAEVTHVKLRWPNVPGDHFCLYRDNVLFLENYQDREYIDIVEIKVNTVYVYVLEAYDNTGKRLSIHKETVKTLDPREQWKERNRSRQVSVA